MANKAHRPKTIAKENLFVWFTKHKELLIDFVREWDEKCKESEELDATEDTWEERFVEWRKNNKL